MKRLLKVLTMVVALATSAVILAKSQRHPAANCYRSRQPTMAVAGAKVTGCRPARVKSAVAWYSF